jgi:uncharacterized integral membrane protein
MSRYEPDDESQRDAHGKPANEPATTESRSDGRHTASDDEGFRHTRSSAAWVATVVAVIFGVALVDFIAQNTRHVQIEFFGASGRVPVAVALLVAALLGAIVVVAAGVVRVTQLRLRIRRQRRTSKNSFRERSGNDRRDEQDGDR